MGEMIRLIKLTKCHTKSHKLCHILKITNKWWHLAQFSNNIVYGFDSCVILIDAKNPILIFLLKFDFYVSRLIDF